MKVNNLDEFGTDQDEFAPISSYAYNSKSARIHLVLFQFHHKYCRRERMTFLLNLLLLIRPNYFFSIFIILCSLGLFFFPQFPSRYFHYSVKLFISYLLRIFLHKLMVRLEQHSTLRPQSAAFSAIFDFPDVFIALNCSEHMFITMTIVYLFLIHLSTSAVSILIQLKLIILLRSF